jgi:protein TonB
LNLKFSHFILISLAAHLLAAGALVFYVREKGPEPERQYFVKIVEEKPEPPPPGRQKLEMDAPPAEAPEEAGTALAPGDGIPEEEKIPEERAAQRPGPLSRLFNRDLIEEFARDGLPAEKIKNGVTFDTREFKYRAYMERLREKVENIWKYPEEAARKGIYGDLVIVFVIRKDGSLGSVELLRTSGYPILDEYALRALRHGEPYWPLPEGWGQSSLTITGHFIYSYYGYYVE